MLDQHTDMISGFDAISRIQIYWHVCMETCLKASREVNFQNVMGELVKLYTRILEYQARAITYLSKPQYKRGRSNNDWNGLVSTIVTLDSSAEKLVALLDPELTRQKLQRQIEEMQNSNKILEEIRQLELRSAERKKRKDENEVLQSLSKKDRGKMISTVE